MSVKCIKANEAMCRIFCDDKDRNSYIKKMSDIYLDLLKIVGNNEE